ncbi:MAG: hypothetical protein KGI27_09875 [Thaumarchaeota archaeon]|nr:hypothetical protein [Nitrososphaerota archaeon]
MPFPSTPGFNFDDVLNLLARASAKTPTPSQSDGYQYFWNDHPEKNKTVMSRYENFGVSADPPTVSDGAAVEGGRESSGYQYDKANSFRLGNPTGDAINRLPIRMRQKYLYMLDQTRANTMDWARPNSDGASGGSWQ